MKPSTRAFEAAGQLKYLFEQEWDLPFVEVDAETFENDLKGIDVLAIPDGYANYGLQSLGAKGKKALQSG